MEDLKNVLKENLEYYLEQEKIIVGLLSTLPKGSIVKKKINGDFYYYLKYRKGKKIVDEYLGKEFPQELSDKLDERKKLEVELKNIREAIKILSKRKNNEIDLIEPVRTILKKFYEEGLWEEGFEIVGSWCFLLYQKYLDFPKYPLKTNDLDILVPIPYRGRVFDISEFFKSLGFRENFNPDGSIFYTLPHIKIEFLAPQKREQKFANQIKSLNIAPQALRFMKILLDYPMTLKIGRGIKINVPSPAAFFFHKILISKRRKNKGKREKDIRQAVYTGKYILINEREKLIDIWEKLPSSWKTKIKTVLKGTLRSFPQERNTINAILSLLPHKN